VFVSLTATRNLLLAVFAEMPFSLSRVYGDCTMFPGMKQMEDSSQSDSKPTHISFTRIQAWREREYKAGRPSGLLDFYRSHGLCIACQASGSKPFPAHWNGEIPIFDRCDVCGGTGNVLVS
jgi:hypothetical protein